MSDLDMLVIAVYGYIAISVLVVYVILTVVMYENNVGEVLDASEDILDVFHVIPRMLGWFRLLSLCVMAILWPISYSFIVLLCLLSRGKTFEEFPLLTRRVFFWIFLGFGKFTPNPNFVPASDDY